MKCYYEVYRPAPSGPKTVAIAKYGDALDIAKTCGGRVRPATHKDHAVHAETALGIYTFYYRRGKIYGRLVAARHILSSEMLVRISGPALPIGGRALSIGAVKAALRIGGHHPRRVWWGWIERGKS